MSAADAKYRETGPQVPDESRGDLLLTQLNRLLEWHVNAAGHIRQVLGVLEYPVSGIIEKPQEGTQAPAAAVSEDRDRGEVATTRRERTAALLATYSHTVPGPRIPEGGILLRHGYLAKKGDGWVRTKKAFVI